MKVLSRKDCHVATGIQATSSNTHIYTATLSNPLSSAKLQQTVWRSLRVLAGKSSRQSQRLFSCPIALHPGPNRAFRTSKDQVFKFTSQSVKREHLQVKASLASVTESEGKEDLDDKKAEAYLERIAYDGPPPYVGGKEDQYALEVLRSLHWAHLLSVPFENLSVHNGEGVELNYDKLYEKIVIRRRGGFCYENNACFAWLLRYLGFNVALLSASVFQQRPDGNWFGPEFDHLLLAVQIGTKRWLADVGFGSSYPDLLDFGTRDEQAQVTGRHRVLPDIMKRGLGVYVYWQWMPPPGSSEPGPGEWQPRYRFSTRPRELEDFREMCIFQQTSEESFFRKGLIVSRIRAPEEGGGVITLTDSKLIVYRADQDLRTEHSIESQERFFEELQRHFGIDGLG